MQKSFLFFLILILFACQGPTRAQEENKMESLTRIISILYPSAPLALMHPSEYCLEDGNLYQGALWHTRHLKIHNPSLTDEKIRSFRGKPVILSGVMKNDLNTILQKKGKCPPDYGKEQGEMQLRSDWVGEETGFHIGHSTRENLRALTFLELHAILPFKGLEIIYREQENSFQVLFTNTLNETLKNIEIIAHYEIYQGKPMPHFESFKREKLSPLEKIAHVFPGSLKFDKQEFPKYRKTRLETILIKAKGENLLVQLEVIPSK